MARKILSWGGLSVASSDERTDDFAERRAVLRAIGGSALAVPLAGCSSIGGGSGNGGDTTDQSGASGTTESSADSGGTDTADGDSADSEAGATGSVTVDAYLEVRASRSNVGKFGTLQTTFENIALRSTSGEAVQMNAKQPNFDLTELEPGKRTHLFQTTVPAGTYEEAALVLPIQEATLADGSDPEFDRTVPATNKLGTDPVTYEAGSQLELTATLALLQIAGDGPWTYTVGFRTQQSG